jgi:hypothetical protein
MNMPISAAELIADHLTGLLLADAQPVLDQLWLRSALVAFRKNGVHLAERDAFDARADRILAQLDPQERP